MNDIKACEECGCFHDPRYSPCAGNETPVTDVNAETPPRQMECKLFSGENAEQYEAMKDALARAAKQMNYATVYDYLDHTPKTSLVVELVNALNELGFDVTPKASRLAADSVGRGPDSDSGFVNPK